MYQNFFLKFKEFFDLKHDTDVEGTLNRIRNNVDFVSGNAWTLIFAIFIACVGLNINSTSVVIGAMLISPLMGPILGAGLALGINDFDLFKKSLYNLALSIFLSILTSSLFFMLTPLKMAHSELLARTNPTLFDVIIAIFGGSAGFVAISRKETSNVVPGVAIATALMPPLCTAGYGLATLNFKYFFGAFYLFTINSVFICLSSLFFVRLLKFEEVEYLAKKERSKIKRYIWILALIVFLPSVYLASTFILNESYTIKSNKFISSEMVFPKTVVIDKNFIFTRKEKKIILTLLGEKLDDSDVNDLKNKMNTHGLSGVDLILKQLTNDEEIEARLLKKLYTKNDSSKEDDVSSDKEIFHESKLKHILFLKKSIGPELKILFPNLKRWELSLAPELETNNSHQLTFFMSWQKGVSRSEKEKCYTFIRTRVGNDKNKPEFIETR